MRSSSKPIVGINTNFIDDRKNGEFSAISTRYFNAVEKAGGIPILLPQVQDEEDLAVILSRVDAVILTDCGKDLDPQRDGFMRHSSTNVMPVQKEKFDRMLASMLSEMRIPTLGIGVGMQLLNVTCGGNLFLDIATDIQTAILHQDKVEPAHRHTLEIVPDSMMEEVYRDGEIRVTSQHHTAVDEVAPGFKVTARCPDGVVEAIESEMTDWLAVGVQFNPASKYASALDLRVFEEFFKGVWAKEPTAV